MKRLIVTAMLSCLSLTAFSATQSLSCKSNDGNFTASFVIKNVSTIEADLQSEKAQGTMTMKDKNGKVVVKKDIKIALQANIDGQVYIADVGDDLSPELDGFMPGITLDEKAYGKSGTFDGQIDFGYMKDDENSEANRIYDEIKVSCNSQVK